MLENVYIYRKIDPAIKNICEERVLLQLQENANLTTIEYPDELYTEIKKHLITWTGQISMYVGDRNMMFIENIKYVVYESFNQWIKNNVCVKDKWCSFVLFFIFLDNNGEINILNEVSIRGEMGEIIFFPNFWTYPYKIKGKYLTGYIFYKG